MAATVMDGKALAACVRAEVAVQVEALGAPVGLATVLVGGDPASAIYVRRKHEACQEVGIEAFDHHLPAETSEADLLALVARLNADSRVNGILVQLPLPDHIDEGRVLRAVAPLKDVDGFHPQSAGQLYLGEPTFVPATPSGVLELLAAYDVPIAGAHAVVVGRSAIVGKPAAHLLLQANATVTICHSRTRDLAAITRQADILVAAVGRPAVITTDMVKPGATVIDVGVSRIEAKIVGDVDFDSVQAVAGAITPMPGGTGPMTIGCLLENTLSAAKMLGAFPSK